MLLYLHVYVCIVHTVYENGLLFLFNITGPNSFIEGRPPSGVTKGGQRGAVDPGRSR